MSSVSEGVSRHAEAPRWLRHVLRFLALGIAALHTFVAVRRQSMNEDGVNYLDIGTAYMNGDWQTAINAIWSPLYSWIVGAVIHLAQPSVWWEFPVVQMTNFGIFAAALICFEFFWRQLTQRYYNDSEGVTAIARFPPAGWWVVGYSLFIWSSLNLIEMWAVTPDMCVAALVYLAAGMLFRLSRRDATPRAALMLGVVLATGYLAKAVLFPLGIVAIMLAGIIRGSSLGSASRILLTLASFVIVAVPYLIVLSIATGHVTFGEVGRFTYMKHVNGLEYPHWTRTLEQVDGAPEHGPRRVFERPAVYTFAEPIGGTYPLSFDPSYWTQGLVPRIDAARQLRALIANAQFYFNLFVREQGGFAVIALLLILITVASSGRPQLFSPEMALVAWSLSAFGVYALVYAEGRYVAPFVVLFWSGLLAAIKFPDLAPYRRLATIGGVILAMVVWVNIGVLNVQGLAALLGVSVEPAGSRVASQNNQFGDRPSGNPAEIASGLLRLGLKQGDHVGFIGYSFAAFWARLARVRIVAEVEPSEAENFWKADRQTQSRVLHAFSSAGATAVVAQGGPSTFVPSGWLAVGETGYLVHFVR